MAEQMKDTAADAGPLGGGQVRALKIAIAVMGVLIVVGLLTVIARIIYLAGKPKAQPASAGSIVVPDARLALPAGAAIRQVSLSGDRLAVHYEAPAGAGIAILDLATGRVLSRVQVVPDPPRN